MEHRPHTLCAVMLMLIRQTELGQQILLQKRKNTGYADGCFDVSVAGHVEVGESMTAAMCREAREELGLQIDPRELSFVCLIDKRAACGSYANVYFALPLGQHAPRICEPDKIEELRWVSMDVLPKNLIDDRQDAIANLKANTPYSAFGWEST